MSLTGKSFQTRSWLATRVWLARASIWHCSYESLENQLAREFKLPSRDFLWDLFSYFTPFILVSSANAWVTSIVSLEWVWRCIWAVLYVSHSPDVSLSPSGYRKTNIQLFKIPVESSHSINELLLLLAEVIQPKIKWWQIENAFWSLAYNGCKKKMWLHCMQGWNLPKNKANIRQECFSKLYDTSYRIKDWHMIH